MEEGKLPGIKPRAFRNLFIKFYVMLITKKKSDLSRPAAFRKHWMLTAAVWGATVKI